MNFKQRFAYYLLGLFIGGFTVYYFWDAKETKFCYFPNCRVLKDIRSKSFIVSEEAKKNASIYSNEDIKLFLTDGDVDFDLSNIPEKGGNKYVIEAVDKDNKIIILEILNYTNRAVLKSIKFKE